MIQVDYKYIKSLLDKFLHAQTTEEEEQILGDYFCGNDNVPPEWQVYKDLFSSFETDVYDLAEDELDAMLTVTPTHRRSAFVKVAKCAVAACVLVALSLISAWLYTGSSIPASHQKVGVVVANDNSKKGHERQCGKSIPLLAEVAKEDKMQLAENVLPKKKRNIKRSERGREGETSVEVNGVSTSELAETLKVLADMDTTCSTITAIPHKNGFLLNAMYVNGQSCAYQLNRCSGGVAVELTSQLIDN